MIRLGEVYKYQNQHDKALDLFDEAIMICQEEGVNQSLDFAYQHLGKCLMEMKRYDEAERSLQLALQIRMEKGNAELIHSTRIALVEGSFDVKNLEVLKKITYKKKKQ